MRKVFAKKRYSLLLLVVMSACLVSLGVRLPTLSGFSSTSSKPKPRPRAIIRNGVKSCKEIVKKLSVGAVPERVSLTPHVICLTRFLEPEPRPPHDLLEISRPARAPPLYS